MDKKIVAVSLILLLTLTHTRGLNVTARLQNCLTLLQLALVMGLIVLGFTMGDGSYQHFHEICGGQFNWEQLKSMAFTLMLIGFSYSGWNASVYIGSEIKNPQRNIPLSLCIGTCFIILLYMLLNLLFIYVIGPEAMKGKMLVGSLLIDNILGASSNRAFSFVMAIVLLSSVSALIILGSRMCHAMAKNHDFFPIAAKVHKKKYIPTHSIILQGIMASLIVLSGTFEQILTYIGFVLGIFPILTILALFKLRYGRGQSLKLHGFPYPAVIYMLFGIGILGFSIMEKPVEALISILSVLAGIPVYLLLKRYRQGTGCKLW